MLIIHYFPVNVSVLFISGNAFSLKLFAIYCQENCIQIIYASSDITQWILNINTKAINYFYDRNISLMWQFNGKTWVHHPINYSQLYLTSFYIELLLIDLAWLEGINNCSIKQEINQETRCEWWMFYMTWKAQLLTTAAYDLDFLLHRQISYFVN